MKNNSSIKVALFAVFCLGLILFLSLQVSDFKFSSGGTYVVYVEMKSAEGIDHKTPVLVAGIDVGIVESVELTAANKAKLGLRIKNNVQLSSDVTAELRKRGVLGDVYLELIPGHSSELLTQGQSIASSSSGVDFNELAKNLNDVAINLKEVSGAIKTYVSPENSPFSKIMKNIEKLTGDLATFSGHNRENMDAIVVNLKELTSGLKGMVNENAGEVKSALAKIESITQKIDSGKGTIGRLINDDSTVDKVNEALDGVNEFIAPVTRLQTEVGYRLEYLGNSKNYKNYVSLALKPRPDKAFLFEFVTDSDPRPNRILTTNTVTTSSGSSTVSTERLQTDPTAFRFSAQLAKNFYDFTIRAGIIESSGGFGLDYNKGPFGLQFSAFGFDTEFDRPRLKAMASVNLTNNLYLVGGADDFISRRRDADWFVGAGIRFLDEDIKSLLGAFSFKR